MERKVKIGQAYDRSKLSFLGGIAALGEGMANLGEGMANIFGGDSLNLDRIRNRTRRHYSVQEDPYGHLESAARFREIGKDISERLERKEE